MAVPTKHEKVSPSPHAEFPVYVVPRSGEGGQGVGEHQYAGGAPLQGRFHWIEVGASSYHKQTNLQAMPL